jgi:hypothetical protein
LATFLSTLMSCKKAHGSWVILWAMPRGADRVSTESTCVSANHHRSSPVCDLESPLWPSQSTQLFRAIDTIA